MKCVNCGTKTSNQKFCSRSCSATFTNKISPKRKTTRRCAKCDNTVANSRTSLCENHLSLYKSSDDYKTMTIGEYRNKQSVVNKHPSWKHSSIRNFARSWLKHLTKQPCRHCGYDKHVELAHVKAVSEFSDDALLLEVNNEENVIPLCPNCHWEFDNLPRNK